LKLGHAETIGVHHFKAVDAAFGQPQGGQFQTHVMDPIGWHQDGATTFGVFVGHVHGGQLGNHGATVFVSQIGVQNAVVGLATHDHANDSNGYQQDQPQGQTHALTLIQGRKALRQRGVYRYRSYSRHDHFQCNKAYIALYCDRLFDPARKTLGRKAPVLPVN